MQRILVIGFGDVAQRLAPRLVSRFRVYGLYRRPEQADALRALGVTPVAGDLDDFRSLKRLKALADWVLHFAPPPASGSSDPRTRRLLAWLARDGYLAERRLAYVSTTGVYGDAGGAWVAESRPAAPQNARAVRRVDAEQRLRRAARAGLRVSILRAPGIYAAERLPLDRLARGTPALNTGEDSWSNHIHADDLGWISLLALLRGRSARVYNASDDEPLAMGDYFDQVADWAGLARPKRISREEAEKQLPESLLSFMRESRRLDNQRLRKELRVTLEYPSVRKFLQRNPAR